MTRAAVQNGGRQQIVSVRCFLIVAHVQMNDFQ